MNVILLIKEGNLQLGENQVKPGYARNWLFPKNKAVPANAENIAKFNQQRVKLELQAADAITRARARAEQLTAIESVIIVAKAREEGKLFGSVGVNDIVKAFADRNVTLNKREVYLAQGALRTIGKFDVAIQLHHEVTANVKIEIVAEA